MSQNLRARSESSAHSAPTCCILLYKVLDYWYECFMVISTEFPTYRLLGTGISIISTGHLGVTEFAAASLGMLHTNVAGLSIIIGSNSALDTLANQVS